MLEREEELQIEETRIIVDQSQGRRDHPGLHKENLEGCWNCGKKGHIQQDCKAPKKQHENNNQGGKDTVNISEESISDALILSSNTCHGSWVIDFGASFHDTSSMDVLHDCAG